MRIYLFIAAVAGGVTYLLTPLIRHIAIEIGAVGEVRARDVHTVPTHAWVDWACLSASPLPCCSPLASLSSKACSPNRIRHG